MLRKYFSEYADIVSGFIHIFTKYISSKTINYKENKLNIHNISPCVEIMQNVKKAQSARNTSVSSVTKITFFYMSAVVDNLDI